MGRRASAERGFTLIEMLVALMLLSLVGLSLARFQTFQIGGANRLALASAAQIEAENRAVDLMIQPRAPQAPLSGESANAGRRWHWTATPSPPPSPELLPQVVAVDIAVSAQPGGPPLATRRIIRPLEHRQ